MSAKGSPTGPAQPVPFRAALIALVLIPFNSYWVLHLSYVYDSNRPASLALLFNVLYIVLILVGVNALVRRVRRGWALSQVELLLIYAMLAQATVFAGRDMIQVLVPLLANGFHYATPENEWRLLFQPYLPRWLVVDDAEAYDGFYRGLESLYRDGNWQPWVRPLALWIGFIAVLSFTFLCMGVLVRRQWSEHEKLTYPVVALPLEITRADAPTTLFRNGTLWTGVAIAATLNLLNALGQAFPQFPRLPLYKEIPVTTKPWSAMAPPGLRFSLFPFAVGLGYFIPLDLAFSGWFFYLFWQSERVVGAAMGWTRIGFPFHVAQLQGTWIALLLFVLWNGRRHFRTVLRAAFRSEATDEDRSEALSYRTAVFGLLIGFAVLVLFASQAGMSPWFALLFFGFYLAMSATIARVRAELGPPAHDFYNAGPDTILTSFLGTRAIGRRNLSVLSLFFWLNHLSYRSHPMPHQLEGLWLARRTNAAARRFAFYLLLGAVFGAASAAWGHLDISYRMGLENGRSWYARAAYSRLAGWLRNPRGPEPLSIAFTGVGFLFSMGLLMLRRRFLWFPLHPVGYVVSSWWTFTGLWFPLFIAWFVKLLVLRFGGMRVYRRLRPFFFGLIVGDVLMASSVSLISSATGVPVRYLSW